MPIHNFKVAWKFYKLEQDLSPLHATDILAIIEGQEGIQNPSKQLLLLQLAMFLLLVICCQGG